jgi:hypothetical protein
MFALDNLWQGVSYSSIATSPALSDDGEMDVKFKLMLTVPTVPSIIFYPQYYFGFVSRPISDYKVPLHSGWSQLVPEESRVFRGRPLNVRAERIVGFDWTAREHFNRVQP